MRTCLRGIWCRTRLPGTTRRPAPCTLPSLGAAPGADSTAAQGEPAGAGAGAGKRGGGRPARAWRVAGWPAVTAPLPRAERSQPACRQAAHLGKRVQAVPQVKGLRTGWKGWQGPVCLVRACPACSDAARPGVSRVALPLPFHRCPCSSRKAIQCTTATLSPGCGPPSACHCPAWLPSPKQSLRPCGRHGYSLACSGGWAALAGASASAVHPGRPADETSSSGK